MTMQHKRGDFEGRVITVDRGLARMDKAAHANAIRIDNLSMASSMVVERIVSDYPGMRAAWYCLQVRIGREMAVEKVLLNGSVETLVVRSQPYKTVKRGRVCMVNSMPVISGYVLVRCLPLPAAMMGLLAVEHVIDVVGGAVSPYRADDESIERFKRLALEGKYDHSEGVKHDFLLHEQVRVTDGPFASFPALITAIDDEKGRVKVEVGIFGRQTPVELDIAQIEKM